LYIFGAQIRLQTTGIANMAGTAQALSITQNICSSMNQDRLDAAHALLGVSPATVAGIHSMMPLPDFTKAKHVMPMNGGLDALAALATASMAKPIIAPGCYSSGSSDEEYEAMPPPPPRRRMRAASNPEGMEKWDSLSHNRRRQHFVLPQSIIEEELKEAKASMELMQEEARENSPSSVVEDEEEEETDGDEEEDMTHEELLSRARSRLLEDLSDASLQDQKGGLTLPHSLSKYKEVRNVMFT
jgi:hypothetical protein